MNKCSYCSRVFTLESNLKRHQRACFKDKNVIFSCSQCHRTFTRSDNYKRHSKSCKVKNVPTPSTSSTSIVSSARKRKIPNPQIKQKNIKKRKIATSGFQNENTTQPPTDLKFDNEKIETVMKQNWDGVKSHSREGPTQTMINVRWPDQSTPNFENILRPVFNNFRHRFKIQASHGFVLSTQVRKEDDDDNDDDDDDMNKTKYRYFHASENNASLFTQPHLISNQNDFNTFLSDLTEIDHLEHCRLQRPDTKWTVHSISNTSFYLYPLKEFPIGCCLSAIPNHIKLSKGVYSLEKDKHTGLRYSDNLCFLRCVALHNGAKLKSLSKKTKTLLERYLKKTGKSHYEGVTLNEINKMEKLFKIPIEIFTFEENISPPALICLRRSKKVKTKTKILQLLLVENHFCYINDIDKVGHAFACTSCQKLWKNKKNLIRHMKKCTGESQKHIYPGGVYIPPPTPLEILKQNGIEVDVNQIFPFRATYDFESYFEKQNLPKTKKNDCKTKYTARHIPLSVSVCSNVPNFMNPKCFINEGNVQKLVNNFVDYLEEISLHSFELMKIQYAPVYEQIAEKKQLEYEDEEGHQIIGLSSDKLAQILDNYLQELIVLGFHSSHYDLNTIKCYLFKRLCREEDEVNEREKCVKERTEEECMWVTADGIKFLVKDKNQYKCVATERLKFLDIKSYLSPGCSYAQYLTAFNAPQRKGFFPYEYIDSIEKLNEKKLPPHKAFFSSLKNKNITAAEYAYLERVWKEENMSSLRDLLIWYNNLDTVPFLSAVEEQSKFYQKRGIDMFKDGIGVPGLTLRYLFKTVSKDVYFSLFSKGFKDLHSLLRSNLVGGPSIIFHRYHEKNKTNIRSPEGKPVQTLEGFDAIALYLSALMQEMPTGHPVIREREKNFKPTQVGKFGLLAREWLEWTQNITKNKITHKFNGGEQRLGKRHLPVDGWDPVTKTAFQFHGCKFHGCPKCQIKYHFPHPFKKNITREQLFSDTQEKTDYLKNKVGVNVVQMWECEWNQEKVKNPLIQDFLSKLFSYYYKTPFLEETEVNEQKIIEFIKNNKLFGLVQCDISVPNDQLKKEYFSELPPIFKNTNISRDDIGDVMKNYAISHKILSQPRKSLISSFYGKDMLVITPLLKFYINKGLIISNIKLVVEYTPNACFKDFGERVSDARRQGDQDATKKIIGDTYKLLGNSAYGKTITNISHHCNVDFVNDKQAFKKNNDPLFKKLTPLTENWNEVESRKKICATIYLFR